MHFISPAVRTGEPVLATGHHLRLEGASLVSATVHSTLYTCLIAKWYRLHPTYVGFSFVLCGLVDPNDP